jgi:hypothetical protein
MEWLNREGIGNNNKKCFFSTGLRLHWGLPSIESRHPDDLFIKSEIFRIFGAISLKRFHQSFHPSVNVWVSSRSLRMREIA